MDHNRFDSLTKDLASGATRRSVLKVALGTAAAGLLTSVGMGETLAATRLRAIGETCRKTSDCVDGTCDIASDGRRRCGCTTPVVGSIADTDYTLRTNSAGFTIPVLDGEITYPQYDNVNLKQECLGDFCPIIEFCDRTIWAYSFIDNRFSLELVAYDGAGNVIGAVEKGGARYIDYISVDAVGETVSFVGQAGASVVVTWSELRSLAGIV